MRKHKPVLLDLLGHGNAAGLMMLQKGNPKKIRSGCIRPIWFQRFVIARSGLHRK